MYYPLSDRGTSKSEIITIQGPDLVTDSKEVVRRLSSPRLWFLLLLAKANMRDIPASKIGNQYVKFEACVLLSLTSEFLRHAKKKS